MRNGDEWRGFIANQHRCEIYFVSHFVYISIVLQQTATASTAGA